MFKNKLMLPTLLVILCFLMTISSVAAMDNSTFNDNLKIEDNSSQSQLESYEADNLTKIEDNDELNAIAENDSLTKSDESNLTISVNSTVETLSVPVNSTEDNILTSSVSVSSNQGHTYYKGGYIFKVSPYQYKKIKQAIYMGKKQQFLDWGFKFTVKTNKIIKVKVLKKAITKYKKVRYEWLTRYPYRGIKVANLNNYYKNGWKKYSTGYESTYGKKYLGYNYVILKKVYKTYKTIVMRVYANIGYVGSEDYVTGQHAYFPWVSLQGMKFGYSPKYLNGFLLM